MPSRSADRSRSSLVRLRSNLLAVIAPTTLALSAVGPPGPLDPIETRSLVGSGEKLLLHYERWKARHSAGERRTLRLSPARGHRLDDVGGFAHVDFAKRSLTIELDPQGAGGERGAGFDIWLELVDGHGERSWHPLGSMPVDSEGTSHAFALDGAWSPATLELEGVGLTRSGRAPDAGLALQGAPGLFERLEAHERALLFPGEEALGQPFALGWRLPVAASRRATTSASSSAAPATRRFTLPAADALVALGERVFFEETFDGNGRTCGTCHPAENNFTIDPAWIETLSDDDPLFVAENVPALDSSRNGGLVFEVPRLMRKFGLIVENLDGFGDPANRFVLRGVPHVLGMATSIEPGPNLDQPLVHLTGWGGDGSPGSGSLREFTNGAVRQHFTRTMAREPGVDFRLPTVLELNAIEAFLLSLGRTEDAPFMAFEYRDARVRAGLSAFGNEGLCSTCHSEAGASGAFFPDGGNFNVNTGVEQLTRARLESALLERPVDGGFGTNPNGDFTTLEPNPDESFGDRTFNVPSIVEFADTLPAFHNNATADARSGLADTVEGAVAFYNTQEFRDAFSNGQAFIDLTEQQIDDIGAFLRAVNALDNIRQAREYVTRAVRELGATGPDLRRATRLAELAGEEVADARRVLSEVALHPIAVQRLHTAGELLLSARSGSAEERFADARRALQQLERARRRIVQE